MQKCQHGLFVPKAALILEGFCTSSLQSSPAHQNTKNRNSLEQTSHTSPDQCACAFRGAPTTTTPQQGHDDRWNRRQVSRDTVPTHLTATAALWLTVASCGTRLEVQAGPALSSWDFQSFQTQLIGVILKLCINIFNAHNLFHINLHPQQDLFVLSVTDKQGITEASERMAT